MPLDWELQGEGVLNMTFLLSVAARRLLSLTASSGDSAMMAARATLRWNSLGLGLQLPTGNDGEGVSTGEGVVSAALVLRMLLAWS